MNDTSIAVGIRPWALYSNRQRWVFLAILFLVSTSNYLDRNIVGVLLVPIKEEFRVSDTMLGLLSGFSFALFYATLGLPIARWADHGNRKTIIGIALTVWSLMTALCGVAQNFWQLALARVGVGAGESGAIPPAQSLIADYFPPERRAIALAIFMSASSAGYLLGFVGGGQIAVHYGWRVAFFVSGTPGLALALLVIIFLREPRTISGFRSANEVEGFKDSVRILLAKGPFRQLLVGLTLYFFFAYGALVFVAPFLVRVIGVPLSVVSIQYGTVAAVAAVTGGVIGGLIADFLAARDMRWLSWIPAIAFLVACPIYMLAFSSSNFVQFLLLGGTGYLLLSIGLSPIFAAVLAVCGIQRRAVAIAIIFFSANLLGLGLGPVLTGAISDLLTPALGKEGLRYALIVVPGILVPTAWCFFRAGRQMSREAKDET
jgi:predicted MFS family arabinose efflux permease